MFTIKGLNHVVLFVRDVARARAFYCDVLRFSVVESFGDKALFLRANGSDNHHDLGLFEVGPDPAPLPPAPRVGLYHCAWELATIDDLAKAREKLMAVGSYCGESDHGNSLSVYAKDPDDNEFEVFWMVPRDEWSARGFGVRPLDLAAEIANRIDPVGEDARR